MKNIRYVWPVIAGFLLLAPVSAQVYSLVTNNAQIRGVALIGTARANRLTISGTATTVSPTVTATGTDTNVGINLVPKGTGAVANGGGTIRSIGASTAAAGNALANATALPAGTATIYPTTAADDTVGVKLTASDQVTGRTVYIGNGVSNKILKVYAPSGGVINGAAADAAFSSVSGKGVIITCLSGSGNTWLAW